VIVGTTLASTINLGGDPLPSRGAGTDTIMLVLSEDGEHLASERWGGAVPVVPRGIVVDDGGRATIALSLNGGAIVNFGGGPIANVGTSASIAMVQFDVSQPGVPTTPASVNVTWRWNKVFGSPSLASRVWALAVAPNGDLVIGGDYIGGFTFDPPNGPMLPEAQGGVTPNQPDAFVARLTSEGEHIWSFSWFGLVSDSPDVSHAEGTGSVTVLPSGNIVLTGNIQGDGAIAGVPVSGTVVSATPSATGDAVIALLSPEGRGIWAMAPVRTARSLGLGVARTANGSVVAIGTFTDFADFGHGPLHREGVAGNYLFLGSFPQSGPSPAPVP
jgi:hypothetical protein